MRSFALRIICVLGVISVSLVVSGCTGTWTGKGKEVAAAIEKSSAVPTGRFSGSMEIQLSGMPMQSGAPETFVVTFSGLGDSTDPANPRMVTEFNSPSEGEHEKIIMPGDGRVYASKRGRTYSYPVEKKTEAQEMEASRVMSTLGASVGGFRESQPMTNIQGDQVPAIYATVDKGKLCGPVLESLGDAFKSTADDADFAKSVGADPAQGIKGMCEALIRKDPSVWFGISAGLLTDIALRADLVLPLGMTVSMTVQFHQYELGERVGKIRVPASVTKLSSEAEFKRLR